MAKFHQVATPDKWLKARLDLLEAEKKLTRQSDKVAKKRMALPWVEVEKYYLFDTEQGKLSLADLFCGRSQLLVYHFMYGPEYQAGCPSCSAIADGFNGISVHLVHHDVMFWAVSRAPLHLLQNYERRMGWTFPWASSYESDFNYDFNVSFTEEQQRAGDTIQNYHKGHVNSKAHMIKATEAAPEGGAEIAASVGTDWATYTRELPGMSAFALQNGKVYHTYSTFERGLDSLWGMYQWLDRAPLGRNEAAGTKWFKRNDEYGDANQTKSCCNNTKK